MINHSASTSLFTTPTLCFILRHNLELTQPIFLFSDSTFFVVIPHFFLFAYDTILILENDKDNFSNALSLFQNFELCSKLKINLSISGLDRINLDSQAIYSIDSGLSNFGVVYYLLGCSLGRDARFVSFWDPDMEKILSILMIEKGLIFL